MRCASALQARQLRPVQSGAKEAGDAAQNSIAAILSRRMVITRRVDEEKYSDDESQSTLSDDEWED